MADREQRTVSPEMIATPAIEKRIFVIRDRQVMLDQELADLYGVETKRLIEQVKRNLERFPEDFMSQLRKEEADALRSQIATSNAGRGGRRYAPYVFTEQGVAMLSSVLRSKTAIAVNIEIVRAFVELRRVANSCAAIEEETGADRTRHGWSRRATGANLRRPSSADRSGAATKTADRLSGPGRRGGLKSQPAT